MAVLRGRTQRARSVFLEERKEGKDRVPRAKKKKKRRGRGANIDKFFFFCLFALCPWVLTLFLKVVFFPLVTVPWVQFMEMKNTL